MAPHTVSATCWKSIPVQGYCATLVARPGAIYGGGPIRLGKELKNVYAILLSDDKGQSIGYSILLLTCHVVLLNHCILEVYANIGREIPPLTGSL